MTPSAAFASAAPPNRPTIPTMFTALRPHLGVSLLLCLLTLTGCGEKSAAPSPTASTPSTNDAVVVSEGKIANNTYNHPGFGWTMKIPAGWQAHSMEKTAADMDKGKAALEKTIGEAIVDNTVNLLDLGLDQFNQFTSAAQPYDTAVDGPYANNQKAVFDVLIKTYEDNGMKVVPQVSEEVVGGVTFAVLHMSIFLKDGDKEIMQQTMYDALLGARSLTVSIMTNDASHRAAMLGAWRASTFDRAVWGKAPVAPAVTH